MKHRVMKVRARLVVIVTLAEPRTPERVQHAGAARPGPRTGEWLSEEEMPDYNIDGTPMVNGIDLNGRPYGRSATWEDDPWHVDAVRACGPNPLAASASLGRGTGAPASHVVCNVCMVIGGYTRDARRRLHATRPTRSHTRFHRSASSRRARRWRHEEAGMHRRIACWWFILPADALGSGTNGTVPPEAG